MGRSAWTSPLLYMRESKSLLCSVYLLDIGKVVRANVTVKGHDLFMQCIDDPLGLREEALLQLERGRDPVARTNDHSGTVQIIEAHLGSSLTPTPPKPP